ncbi:Flp pilus assembly protein CpaB [Vibrio olivae]|uniref:Flp pilus assembly protein CpaB n=1 Tax=Vibrio olivae TaxID=1243002 RepID=A0ABV5HM74_9VIBR
MLSKFLKQPKWLRILSASLLIAAFGFAWLGYSEHTHPTVKLEADSPTIKYDIWQFTQSVAKGTLITQELLIPVQVNELDANIIVDPQQAIGKRVNKSVPYGTKLTTTLLATERPIIDELPPNHRAVAIKANEVLSVGGYLQAGDHVDIMYLLKPNRESGSTTTARRLASNVPILAIGGQLTSTDEDDIDRENAAKSIVLCVHESLASTILLAEMTGELRLAAVGTKDLLNDSPNTLFADTRAMSSEFLVRDKLSSHSNLLVTDYTVNLKRFGPAKKTKPSQTKKSQPKSIKTAPANYIEIIQGGTRSMVKTQK